MRYTLVVMPETSIGDPREAGEKATNPLEQKVIALFQDNPAMAPFKDPRAEGVFHARIGEGLTSNRLPDNHRRLNIAIWSNPPRLGECEIIVGKKTGDTSGELRTIQARRVSYGTPHDLSFSDSVTTTELFKGETEGSGRREERTVTDWKAITAENIEEVLAFLQKEGIEPFLGKEQAENGGTESQTK